jgi:hypothetical protein
LNVLTGLEEVNDNLSGVSNVSSDEDSASNGNLNNYNEGNNIEDTISDVEMDIGGQRDVNGARESSLIRKLRASPAMDVESIRQPTAIVTSESVCLAIASHIPDTKPDTPPTPSHKMWPFHRPPRRQP